MPILAHPLHFLALPIPAFAYRRGSSPCQATPHLRVSERSHAILIHHTAWNSFTFSLPLRTSICTAFPSQTRASPRSSMPLLCHAALCRSVRLFAIPLHNPTIRYCTMPLLIFAFPRVASPLLFSARPRLALPLQRPATLYTVPMRRSAPLCPALPLRGYSLLN